MRHFRLLPLLLSGLLLACPRSEDSTQAPSATPPPSTASSIAPSGKPTARPQATPRPGTSAGVKQPVPATAGLHKGIFVYGDGYQTFKACGNDQEIWVVDTAQKTLGTRYQALKLMELAPTYIEVQGQILPASAKDGFAADYKLALHVSRVDKIQPFGPNQGCFETEFMAVGSGPEWMLQVLKGGDVFFQAREGEFPYVDTLAYSPPRQEGNTWHYSFRFRTPDEERLEASFTEESCQHGNQDYPFSVRVQFRGSSYSGCARR